MSSNIQDGKARQGSNSHIVETNVVYPHTKSGSLNLETSSNIVLHRAAKSSLLNPTSQPASTFSGFTDVRLVSTEPIRDITLSLEFTTSSATAIKLDSDMVLDAINYIEILSENGSLAVSRIEGDHLKLGLAQAPSIGAFRAALQGIQGGVEGDGVEVSTDASFTSYVPIFKNLLSEHEIFGGGLNAPMTIRVWWASGCDLSVAGVELGTLVLGHWQYDASIRQKLMNNYLTGPPLAFRYAAPRFQTTQETITPGARHVVRLSAVNGLITSIVASVKISGVATKLEKLDMMDSSNQSIIGGSPLDFSYVNSVVRADENRVWPSSAQAFESESWFHIPISSDTAAHESFGSIWGYVIMNGFHSVALYLPTTATNTAETCEVTFLYSSMSLFNVNKGQTSVQNS